MSTKAGIKWRQHTQTQPGFHLYSDVIDEFAAEEGGTETPVYLCLEGVAVQLETLSGGGANVTVTIPREMARELGLLPPAKT